MKRHMDFASDIDRKLVARRVINNTISREGIRVAAQTDDQEGRAREGGFAAQRRA